MKTTQVGRAVLLAVRFALWIPLVVGLVFLLPFAFAMDRIERRLAIEPANTPGDQEKA